MKGKAIKWTLEELAWIEKNRYSIRSVAFKLFCEKFGRTDIKISAYAALCKRKGWFTGRTGQYSKNHVPANKGKKMPFNANSARTQFKKGHLGGKAKENIKPMGYERFTKDGYVEKKINNDMPFRGRWRAVHLIRWEEVNGKIPKGHCLKCINGDKGNTSPSNWTCIPRAILPRLAGRGGVSYDGAPDELKPTILAVAKLHHAKHRALKERINHERT